MSTQSKPYLTPEKYLEIERQADFKSEYYQDEMFAMSGAQREHNLITTNAVRELSQQLRKHPCEAYAGDMRVKVTPVGLYTYPDVVVVWGKPEFLGADVDTLLNPTVIIEVLSKSTEAYDRGTKFKLYRTLESLQAYLLVSSMEIGADLYTRQPNGDWLLTSKGRMEDSVELNSIGCLVLADVYEKVEFPPMESAPVG